MQAGSYVILDAYFASKNLIKEFRTDSLHLITRVKINTVGRDYRYHHPPRRKVRVDGLYGESDCHQNLI